MKHFFLVLFIFFSVDTTSQTRCDCFDRLLNLGKHYTDHYKFEKAIGVLKDALYYMEDSSDEVDVFRDLVYCYDTLGNYDSSVAYALKGMAKGLSPREILYYSPRTFARIPAGQMHTWPAPGQEVNWPLYDLAQQMQGLDQYVRNFDRFKGSWVPDSLAPYKEDMHIAFFLLVDSTNYATTMKILGVYGWPTYQKVGFFNAINAHILIHNVRHPWGRRLLDALSGFARRCNGIRPSGILKFEDNRVLHGGEPGMGSGKNLAGFFGVDRYNIIYDLKKADSLRFRYNHVRLKEDVPPGGSLPKDYKPIPYPPNYFCLKKYQIQ